MKLVVFLLAASLFIACTPEEKKAAEQAQNGPRIGGKLPEGVVLQGKSLAFAVSTCEALKEKAATLNSRANAQFLFRVSEDGCDAVSSTQPVTMRLNGDTFSVTSNYLGSYFAAVETHDKGVMANLCSKVLSGTVTSTSIASGPRRHLYEFISGDANTTLIRYSTGRSRSASDTNFVIDEIQTWTVSVDAWNEKYGYLLSQARRQVCGTQGRGDKVLNSELVSIQ